MSEFFQRVDIMNNLMFGPHYSGKRRFSTKKRKFSVRRLEVFGENWKKRQLKITKDYYRRAERISHRREPLNSDGGEFQLSQLKEDSRSRGDTVLYQANSCWERVSNPERSASEENGTTTRLHRPVRGIDTLVEATSKIS